MAAADDDVGAAIRRGHDAERLMNDPTLQRAFAEVREGLVKQLESAALTSRDLEHEVVRSLQLLDAVRNRLQKFIETGRFEQEKLRALDRAKRFLKRAI